MARIHPSAVVHPDAKLGDEVEVGPHAVIHAGAVVGEATRIDAHAVVYGNVVLGCGNYVGVGAVLGGDPQDVNFSAGDTGLIIGDNNVIREYVTIHRASKEGESTRVGSNCYIMAYAHIAHDCVIGNRVIITNYAGLSGFVRVDDGAIISGHVGVHQFVRIGKLAFVSGGSFLNQDVPPFTIASGRPARVIGLNVVGMRRAGMSADVRLAVKRAFDTFYRKGLPRKRALGEIKASLDVPEVAEFVEFIKSSERGVMRFAGEG